MEKRNSTRLRRAHASLVTAVLAACLLPGPAAAVDSCKARVDKKTGLVTVSATGLSGLIAWRDSASEDLQNFFINGCTIDGDSVSGCPLYDPATPEAKVPPPSCEVCVADSGGTECCTRLKGCTPGMRDCQVVTAQAPVAASSAASLTASCPAGYKATGGGGDLGVFLGFYPLDRNLSASDASGWTCRAHNDEAIAGTITCRASCCRMP
jgi:hypothetical protein